MSDEVLNGIPCKKILSEGVLEGAHDHCAIWIAPDYGYSPIRIEDQADAYQLLDSTTAEVSRYKNTDLWVPVKVISERQMNGQFDHKTEYTTTVYSINEPIDAKWFSPESLGLPPGTPVTMMAEKPVHKPHVWDGEKTVTEGELFLAQAATGRTSRYRYILMSLGLALISVALLQKRFAEKRTKKGT